MLRTELNPQLKLQISEQALQYIQQQGGNVVVAVKQTDGCCAGAILAPVCRVGEPEPGAVEYNLSRLSNVNLHISREVGLLAGELEITLEKLFWIKLLTVRLLK